MKFEKRDLIQIENLIKVLKKGQYTLDGIEVLAFANCFDWIGHIFENAKAEVALNDPNRPLAPKEVPNVNPDLAAPAASPRLARKSQKTTNGD